MLIKNIVKKNFPKFYKILGKIKINLIMRRFHKNYPDTKIFYPAKRKLYSQDNQDYIVYTNFFENKRSGVFCDVGGNHPLNLNNTRYFEELGWRGYVFEPLPHMRALWDRHRKAKFFPYAASDTEDEITFSVVKDATGWEDMLSFVKETRDIDYKYDIEDITVQAKTLSSVFEQENITHIDFMSIDVEGHELNVLKGIDFNKVKIDVLTVENNAPSSIIYGDDKIRKLMSENNYILWGRIVGLDDIYVREGFLH